MTTDDAKNRSRLHPLVAVPNVSEGRDRRLLAQFRNDIEARHCYGLDVHSDLVHNRSVLTLAGDDDPLVQSLTELARAATALDLRAHDGVHPRLGVLDVCPIVIDDRPERAIRAAEQTARRIGTSVGLPVFLYGDAARRKETRELPHLRRGGLDRLRQRVREGELVPDEGPNDIDPAYGVVCVGARPPLIAFNVWLEGDGETARRIAADIRTSDRTRRAIRALGWEIERGVSQVSMNLISPDVVGVDDAFEKVARLAARAGVEVVATEIVGLPPQRYLPNPKKEAARLLLQPGRSLESVLQTRA